MGKENVERVDRLIGKKALTYEKKNLVAKRYF